MKKNIILACSIFLVSGCADSVNVKQDQSYGTFFIEKNTSIYVSLPSDGQYGAKSYYGSGLMVSNLIRSAFLRHVVDVAVAPKKESFSEALDSANKSGRDLVAYPTILHWEDRATEWSGIPDKADIKLVIADAKSGQIQSSVMIQGKSGIATFGGDHPQDLLPEPINQYVDELFRE